MNLGYLSTYFDLYVSFSDVLFSVSNIYTPFVKLTHRYVLLPVAEVDNNVRYFLFTSTLFFLASKRCCLNQYILSEVPCGKKIPGNAGGARRRRTDANQRCCMLTFRLG